MNTQARATVLDEWTVIGDGDGGNVRFVLANGDEIEVTHEGDHIDVRNTGRRIRIGLTVDPVAANDVRVWTR